MERASLPTTSLLIKKHLDLCSFFPPKLWNICISLMNPEYFLLKVHLFLNELVMHDVVNIVDKCDIAWKVSDDAGLLSHILTNSKRDRDHEEWPWMCAAVYPMWMQTNFDPPFLGRIHLHGQINFNNKFWTGVTLWLIFCMWGEWAMERLSSRDRGCFVTHPCPSVFLEISRQAFHPILLIKIVIQVHPDLRTSVTKRVHKGWNINWGSHLWNIQLAQLYYDGILFSHLLK